MYTDESGSDNDDYSNSDDEETEKFEEMAARRIQSGALVVKNADGTYKCPLSPGRKKQSYKYRELLAHATGVAKGKKGPEKIGGHRALMKYLEAELGDKPMVPQAERFLYLEQAVPKREARATKLLSPWMGILVNIDNSRRNEKGFKLAAGAADIKEKFQEFNPQRVDVFHDINGHQGTALLTFKNDIHGLEDAQAFEQSFLLANRGSKDWWSQKHPVNLELYGWQANEADLTANLGQLTEHLRKFTDLKTVKDMVEEKERINKQVVEDLVKTVGHKNDLVAASHQQFVILKNVVAEVEALRVKAEEEKSRMEELHKQELESIRKDSQDSERAHNEKLLLHQVALSEKLKTLERRNEEMKEAEKYMRQKNEDERRQFEREKQEAQRLLDEASKQAQTHAAMQCKQRDQQKEMIKKHEGENKALEIAVQEQKMKLLHKQNLELQKQHVKELLEIEKSRESDSATIEDLQSREEMLQETVNTLMIKERSANDELEEARKAAVEVLEKYGVKGKIANKLQGSINKAPWTAACKKKYKYHADGYDMVLTKLISVWEERIGDQNYHPFKNVEIGPDRWERIIDKEDEKLVELKEDLGEEVMNTVATAFLEIEEYNASGRYPVKVAWDFPKNQRVTLKDLLLHLKELLDNGVPPKPKKRTRAQ